MGNYYLNADGVTAANQWIGPYYVGPDGAWIPGYGESQGQGGAVPSGGGASEGSGDQGGSGSQGSSGASGGTQLAAEYWWVPNSNVYHNRHCRSYDGATSKIFGATPPVGRTLCKNCQAIGG